MCGIRFNTDEFENSCQHCGKLALEETPTYHNSLGLWLCSECWEKQEQIKEVKSNQAIRFLET